MIEGVSSTLAKKNYIKAYHKNYIIFHLVLLVITFPPGTLLIEYQDYKNPTSMYHIKFNHSVLNLFHKESQTNAVFMKRDWIMKNSINMQIILFEPTSHNNLLFSNLISVFQENCRDKIWRSIFLCYNQFDFF